MSTEHNYWVVDSISPVMAVINEGIRLRKEFREACRTLEQKYPGAKIWAAENSRVVGIEFSNGVPDGWRDGKRKQYAVPNKKTKLGEEIASQLAQLPKALDAWTFSQRLNRNLKGDYTHWADDHVYFSYPEKIGEAWVLCIPIGCKVEPPGCRQIKTSEYWRMKEECPDGVGEVV